MRQLIFGSTALKHWFSDLKRDPKDLDIMCKEGKNSPGIEHHWIDSFQYILDNNKDWYYVDHNFLYTIKISHAAWDVRWEKTMHDINFMKNKGCILDITLYNMLLKEWEIVHGKKKVKLTGKPEEFFKPTVTRKIDHDQLHHLVKFYDRPMHEIIRKDKNNVACSKELWDNLSYDDKIKCALEEAYVFALERYFEFPPKIALVKALKQLIVSSTKGYFNLFLIDNFHELIYYKQSNYLEKHRQYKELLNG